MNPEKRPKILTENQGFNDTNRAISAKNSSSKHPKFKMTQSTSKFNAENVNFNVDSFRR